METHNRKIAQRSYPIQAGRASVTGCMLPAYSTCWQHNSIKRVGSRNFWADLKTRERGFHKGDWQDLHHKHIANWLLPKKYLLINVSHVGYVIQIFYRGQKEWCRVYSYCKVSFDAQDYWRGCLAFHNPLCSPQFSASTSRVHNVQRTANCLDRGPSKKFVNA